MQTNIFQLVGLLVPMLGFYFHFSKSKDELNREYNLTMEKIVARKARKYRELFLEARKYSPIPEDDLPIDLFVDFVNEHDNTSKYEGTLAKCNTRHHFCENLYLGSLPVSVLAVVTCWLFEPRWLNPYLLIAVIWIYFFAVYITSHKYREAIRRISQQPLLRSEIGD